LPQVLILPEMPEDYAARRRRAQRAYTRKRQPERADMLTSLLSL
jgi:hypothetical protein